MDYFDIKAKEKERSFLKMCKQGLVYLTGNGSKNMITKVTNHCVYFTTEKSKSPLRISRKKLREAIAHIFLKRTAIRHDLEQFTSFSSALMGVLRVIFSDVAKISKTVAGLLRLTLKGTRFIFSGVCRAPKDMELIKQNAGNFVMMSYFNLREDRSEQWRYHLTRLDQKMVLDSGEFSLSKARERGKVVKPITVEEYAKFVIKNREYIHAYFNLDLLGNAAATQRNQVYLEQEVGLPPIPVWHVQNDWAELQRLVDQDYEIIGVGGSVKISEKEKRRVFGELFAKFPLINFHVLGLSSSLLWDFPWFSADSTSWLNPRKNGHENALITPKGSMDMPKEWDVSQGIAFNIQQLVSLEKPSQVIQLELLCPPKLQRPVQLKLALF
jgi:hypothetical protein